MKKICIVTGSRAEFFILENLIKKINKDSEISLHLLVTGSHNSRFFGNTINQIKKSKVKITGIIDIMIKGDKEIDIAKSFSIGVEKFTKKFLKIKPDILLILGDRYEIYAVAIAACFCKIPIAHIYGGESTEGVIDEAIRHSITKLSHIHFVQTKKYFKRVKQLGENKLNIFNVGSLGVEAIKKTNFLKKRELEKKLNIKFRKKNIIITFHSETLKSKRENLKNLNILLKSLNKLKDTSLFFTMPGADINFRSIVKSIKSFSQKKTNSYFFNFLGHEKYFSLCKIADVMIGNSSSGIIEMPTFKKPSINLGERQMGRIQAKSVLNCSFNHYMITKKIINSFSKKFTNELKKSNNPYDNGESSKKILNILKKIKLKKNILKKKFIDLKE